MEASAECLVSDKHNSGHGTARRGLVLGASLAVSFMIYVALSMVAAFLPHYVKRWNFSSGTVGVIFACYPIGTVLCSPLAGWLCGTLGRRTTLIIGLFIMAASTLVFGYTGEICPDQPELLFIAARAVQGAAAALAETAIAAMLAGLYRDKLQRIMSVLETVNGVSYAVGPSLGGALYDATSFKVPFIVCGGLFAALAGVFIVAMPPRPRATDEQRSETAATADPAASIWGLKMVVEVAGVWVMSTAFGMIEPTLADHLGEAINVSSPSAVGGMFSISAASYMAASFPTAILAESRGNEPVVLCGLLVTSVGMWLLGPLPGLDGALVLWSEWLTNVIALILYGTGAALAIIPSLTMLLEAADGVNMDEELKTNTVSAVWNMAYAAGSACGPLLGGLGVQLVNFSVSMTVGGGLVVLYAALLWLVLQVSTSKAPLRNEDSPLDSVCNPLASPRDGVHTTDDEVKIRP